MKPVVWLGRLLVAGACLALGACATVQSMPRYTTQEEVLADRGEPTRKWTDDGGSTTLEYSGQPNGTYNLLITVDSTGVVLDQYNALSPENLARVAPGMSKQEIDHLLGQHRSAQTFPNSGEEVWDWRIPDESPWVVTLFNVHFVDGKVKRTSRSYLYPRDRSMFYDPWFYDPFYHPYYRGFGGGWRHPLVPYPRLRPWYFY